jgi:hypothetical protein
MRKGRRVPKLNKIVSKGQAFPTDAAVMGRIYRHMPGVLRIEHIVPREDLSGLKICDKHPQRVWFDSEQCPCCQIIAEYQANKRGRKSESTTEDRLADK